MLRGFHRGAPPRAGAGQRDPARRARRGARPRRSARRSTVRLARPVFQSVHTIKGTAAMLRYRLLALSAPPLRRKVSPSCAAWPVARKASTSWPVVLDLVGAGSDSLDEVRARGSKRFSEGFLGGKKTGEPGKSDGEAPRRSGSSAFVAPSWRRKRARKGRPAVRDRRALRMPFRVKAGLKKRGSPNLVRKFARSTGLETPARAHRRARQTEEEGRSSSPPRTLPRGQDPRSSSATMDAGSTTGRSPRPRAKELAKYPSPACSTG
jgi:hypothetical protein